MSSAKWRPSYLGLIVLDVWTSNYIHIEDGV